MLSRLKLPENNYSVTAPGAHMFLDYDDAQFFWDSQNKQSQFHCTKCPDCFGWLQYIDLLEYQK